MDLKIAEIIFILLITLFIAKIISEKLQNKKYEEAETMAAEQLVKKNFRFLIDDYGFEYYDLYSFCSNKMLVKVLPGHKTPRIDINKTGESDLYKLDFEWIIKFFSGAFPSENHDYLKYSLETNMIFISKTFQENSHQLIDEFDSWWIPVHVFVYRTIEEKYRNKGQTDIFLNAYKHYYDYLKNAGAI